MSTTRSIRAWRLTDLIITDLMMPVLDGTGLIQAMQRSEPQRDIPCIIMSSIPEDAVRGRVNGHAGFIRKPFRLASVLQLVTNVLARRLGRERDSCNSPELPHSVG